ncbi:MAG: FHA domain-containing protein [Acidobacteria bacterium]|nr:MAG: FHA domain-containing protein [Acidobacteriota bacterium]REK02921.1 MAG: FHA domain-containing protein [Acidobacteriota bacterium]REK13275.1 MAG: FHA domain-containing protein [Acidobacteriota bacterium]REK41269.1 MAG: FHA domain-containing protein [Acidobacteriota bacterium]
MGAVLKIKESAGKTWELTLKSHSVYSIGRAKDNSIVLNDRRVSRKHAHIASNGDQFVIVDGVYEDGELKRSVNKVFVNGKPVLEKPLDPGDVITIGTSQLRYENIPDPKPAVPPGADPAIHRSDMSASMHAGLTESSKPVNYDNKPIGKNQMVMSANEIMERSTSKPKASEEFVSLDKIGSLSNDEEVKDLRRKAQILEMLYEMSKTLGTVFDLKEIFEKATDLIFRVTPSERVVALLADETLDGKILDYSLYTIAAKTRGVESEESAERLTVSRTITQKVMREKVALLSQDAKSDEEFSGAESIVAQGVRSTICAPLITESNVHGVVYADRLDPFATFSQDDLELISAVAAQTAVAVETIKAHKRLAREEVARANYSRFMPEYVVKELLEKPDSFRLGGVNQTVTVLFADIRGFTAFSESEKPERVVNLLNKYFTAMTDIIFEHGGTLDKYLGDGLMAIFGAPNVSDQDADNAVKAAIAMQNALVDLNAELKSSGFAEIAIGIGLHTGVATIGYIGSEKRSEYTAIGDTVNLASRLESAAAGGQILISEATGRACTESFQIRKCQPLQVRNRVQPVSLFEVKWN